MPKVRRGGSQYPQNIHREKRAVRKQEPERGGQKANSSWSTNQKVVLFALGAIVVIGAGIMISRQVSVPCPQATIEPLDHPISKFPDQFYRMPSNGYMSSLEGRNLCVIDQDYPSPKVCDALSWTLENEVKMQSPALYQQQMAQSAYRLDTGFGLRLLQDEGLGITQVTFGENPKRVLNFKKALSFAEETVLKNPREFFSQSPSEIKEAIVGSHQKLFQGFSSPEGPLAGTYRDFCGLVTEAIPDQNVQGFLRLARENGGMLAAPELYQSVVQKFQTATYLDEMIRSLSESERDFVQKYIGFLPPPPEQLPGLMDALATKLKELGNGILDRTVGAIEAASTIHYKIGDIHPFKDGNGRLARFWMNILLQLGGHQSVIFPNDNAYTDAVVREQMGETGAFSKFLEEIILWNRQQCH